jgi:type IV pilus assembly protein PilC
LREIKVGKFIYKAIDKSGEHITGALDATDRKSAVAALTGQGHFVTELSENTKVKNWESIIPSIDLRKLKFGSRVSGKDILAMTTQLSTALKAGLPLLNGLELIHQQQSKSGMKEMLSDLISQVSSGQALSDAMEKHPKIFSPLYISMIRVGETGGILEQTTAQLSGILQRDEKVKTNMKNASAYPIFVLIIGMIAVTIIITWILPQILKTIVSTGATMPLPTRILLSMSHFMRNVFTTAFGWIVIILVVSGFLYFKRWSKTKGRLKWDGFKLKIPILGNVLRTIAVGRFARTLGALTKGGVIILEALAVVRDTLGNELLGKEIDIVAEKVKRGESLAEPLSVSGYFPPLLEMLLNAAETFDTEADSALNKFMAIFPALLILALAVVIGFIIVATLLPIVTMQMTGVG